MSSSRDSVPVNGGTVPAIFDSVSTTRYSVPETRAMQFWTVCLQLETWYKELWVVYLQLGTLSECLMDSVKQFLIVETILWQNRGVLFCI